VRDGIWSRLGIGLDRYDDAMRAGIRVLGPLEAEVEGARADLGGPLQRAVLALLLMERGRVVSVDRMIDQPGCPWKACPLRRRPR
jgi:hypothetical protein